MLLNILQGTGWPSQHLVPNVQCAEAENPCIKWTKWVEREHQTEGRTGAKVLRRGEHVFKKMHQGCEEGRGTG